MEVGLDDMRASNRLLDAIGFDGDPRPHLPIAKPPMRYLVGSQTLISLPKMGNGISNRGKTTWPNTDTILNSEEFCAPGINRQIAIREMGEMGWGGV